MDFHRVTATADPVYAPAMALYRASFPSHEQRQTASQEAILSHPDYHFLVLTEHGAPVGILLNWDTPHFRYIEHFAISPALRGRSFGSRALQAWADRADTPVILEIDPLTTDIAVRRKRFYERLGFMLNPFPHVHPPYHDGLTGHALLVLSRPEALEEDVYQAFAQYLHTVVMA